MQDLTYDEAGLNMALLMIENVIRVATSGNEYTDIDEDEQEYERGKIERDGIHRLMWRAKWIFTALRNSGVVVNRSHFREFLQDIDTYNII